MKTVLIITMTLTALFFIYALEYSEAWIGVLWNLFASIHLFIMIDGDKKNKQIEKL